MGTFVYQAASSTGTIVKDRIESDSEHDAFMAIKDSGLIPIEVRPDQSVDISFDVFLQRFQPISTKHLHLFTVQLSTLLKAGLPLLTSLDIISDQVQHTRFRSILKEVKNEVAKGRTISNACRQFPKVFSPILTSILQAGEESGKMGIMLDRYACYLDRNEKLKGDVSNAMIYPAFLTGVSIGVMIFLTQVVLPNFTDILRVSGAELPISTKIVIVISAFLRKYMWEILFILVIVFAGLFRFWHTRRGRYLFHLLALKAPVWGKIYYKSIIARFMRTMSTLLESGIPFLLNLKLATRVINNEVITKKIETTFDNITKGDRIAEQFKQTRIFNPIAIQMITTGENSGSLDAMCAEIADIYDREIERAIKRLSSTIEPLVLTVVAGGVSFIAVSLISSIMKAVNTFK